MKSRKIVDSSRNPSLIIDEPEIEHVVLDFPRYANTMVELILNSTPQFTIAIFGEWGTGKSTLMKLLERKLRLSESSNHKNLTTWFYPWKYESEQIHDSLPFAISILSKLQKEIESRIKQGTIRNEKDELSEKIKHVLKGLSLNLSIGFPGIANLEIGYEHAKPSGISKLWKKRVAQISKKSKLEEGIELINELFEKIKKSDEGKQTRLVVFIDDLDRCNPNKIIQVFESMKVFLTMPGIIFVVGVSKGIVTNAISNQYSKFGDKFNGMDYLKKFIQLPMTIPVWTEDDVGLYLENLLRHYINKYYQIIFLKNFRLILHATERNPREIKRFLNNFIMANEVFKFNEEIQHTEFLAIQAIQLRWEWFYNYVISKPDFLSVVKNIVFGEKKDQVQLLSEEIHEQIKSEKGLMEFLQGEGELIFSIDEHRLYDYRRAGVISAESYKKEQRVITESYIERAEETFSEEEIPEKELRSHIADTWRFVKKDVDVKHEISLGMARKTIENLLLDGTFNFRTLNVMKKYLPNYEDDKIREILLDIGAMKSKLTDAKGNEIWSLRRSKKKEEKAE